MHSSAAPAAPGPRLHVDVLDGVQLRVEDDILELAERPRALLVRLALEPGVAMTIDELARDLWDHPPPSSAVTLRSIVSRLRSGPLRDVLTGGRGGYALELDPADVDVVRLRGALRAAVADRARLEALEALEATWTGRQLAGLFEAPFARREAARLAEEYGAAMEELAGIRISRGDHDAALATLREMVHRDPLAERPVTLLATALSRSGREAEALRAIDALGDRLRDDAGLDLPESLRELRTSILRREHAPESDRPEPERRGVPLPITAFVGRRGELAEVADARSRSRLVTILGPGGVGKTRLAIEAARADRTGDARQFFLDLVPFRDSASVVAGLADLVGALRPDLDAVAAMLRGAPTLLVLDNAEHLREAVADLVTALLAGCDGLTVLVTSRDALRIPGERRVRVAPLLGDAIDDGVELFAARAGETEATFVLDARSEPLVRALVAAVDGVPLALELAAGRLPMRSLDDLVAEIRERGTVGRGGGQGRHASVAAMIEWSIDLLSEPERELFAQLGGFAGAFSHEAATQICRVEDADVDDLLLELVDRSLVSTSRTADGTVEYRLLIAVRQMARRLCERDRTSWREQHRRWHADLVDRLRPALYSAQEGEATAVLERASNDLNAALDDAVAAADRESALRIVGGLARVWYRRGTLVDGVGRMEEALAIPGAVTPIVEARAQLGLALMRFFMHETEAADAAVTAAIAAARTAGDPSILAIGLAFRAYLEAARGRLEAARASVGEAVGLSEAGAAARATVEMIAADLARFAGAPATALAGLERAHRLARTAGEGWVLTLTAHITARVLIDARRGQEALDLLVPVIRETWEAGRPTHTIAGLVLVAAAAGTLERHAVGARILAAADAQARRYSWEPDASDPEGTRRHRSRLRTALTAEQWQAEQTAGSGLTLGDAVALAAELASPRVRRQVDSAA